MISNCFCFEKLLKASSSATPAQRPATARTASAKSKPEAKSHVDPPGPRPFGRLAGTIRAAITLEADCGDPKTSKSQAEKEANFGSPFQLIPQPLEVLRDAKLFGAAQAMLLPQSPSL